ncbi:hypothetical protein JCM8097_002794 [Rhodosporidiobolus ruineniae]
MSAYHRLGESSTSSDSDDDFPSSSPYPPSRLSARSARAHHALRLLRQYPVPLTCLAVLSLLALYQSLRPTSSSSPADPKRVREDFAGLPLLAFPNGTRYHHPSPPTSPDPWPSRPELAQLLLAVDSPSSSASNPPVEAFDLPGEYEAAADTVWAQARAGWEDAGLNRGEGFDARGRPLTVPREVLYDGKAAGWVSHTPGEPLFLPPVQHPSTQSDQRTPAQKKQDEERKEWVRRAFRHVWGRYKARAWGYDELRPLSGGQTNAFNGWGATVFDALDTLLLMGLKDDYLHARRHIAAVDFSYTTPRNPIWYPAPANASLPSLGVLRKKTDKLEENIHASPAGVPTFETIIRYLGSLLSAYDLTHDPLLLARARELGDWLLPSFSTSSGLLVPTYRLGAHSDGGPLGEVCLAEVGSVGLEMLRLSQVTGDERYWEAAQRSLDTLDRWPATDRLKGLFPTTFDVQNKHTLWGRYTFGGQADSYYEYLLKLYQLLGGAPSSPAPATSSPSEPPAAQYRRMYTAAVDSAHEHLIRPIRVVPGLEGAVAIGDVSYKVEERGKRASWYSMRLDHLTCFAGGMLGLGARLFGREKDMDTAIAFTKACTWAYDGTRTGLAPETMELWAEGNPHRFKSVRLEDGSVAKTVRGDPPGAYASDNRHISRPETAESVWYMYRLTGDRKYQDIAWRMFTSWVAATINKGGFSHIDDVNVDRPTQDDGGIESFVYAETLKYYFLIFSPPDFMSLDDWVFSTEAHPFRVRKPGSSASPASSDLTPFWSSSDPPLTMPPASKVGLGTPVQKWARMIQAASMKGWIGPAQAQAQRET